MSCPSPYSTSNLTTGSYCNFPCNSNQYYYENVGCKPECPANAYKIRIDERGSAYCDLLCDLSEFMSPDGECLLKCNPPLKSFQDNNGIWFCEGPCDDNNFFYNLKKNTCSSNCSDSFEETDPFLYKICYDNDESAAIEVGKSAQTVSKAAVQAVSAISLGSSFAISARISGKIFSNIKYLNISYSSELELAFKYWSSSMISFGLTLPTPNFTESDIEVNSVPYVFEKHEVNAIFLINFWEDLVFLCIFSGIFGVFKLIELIVPHSKIQFIRKIIQNFLLIQSYNIWRSSFAFCFRL